jgi:CitMHS family citrate-Mg2+:H+ or citrate-Ca2+:H+ symporter
MLAFLGYALVIVFMVLIMTKRMSPVTSLILVPLVFGLIGGFGPQLGAFALAGIKSVSTTATMIFFAIYFFSIMISAGLFDPLVKKLVKGDPLKVLVGTAVLGAVVSLDGDGAATYMICCSALLPVYNKLKIKKLYLAVLLVTANSILNLTPWGGPTARIAAILNIDASVLFRVYLPGMLLAIVWLIGMGYIFGLKERKRLGITKLDETAAGEMAATLTEEEAELKRPKLVLLNFILTVIVMVTLISGKVPAAIIFEVGAALALMINYPSLKTQRKIIGMHAENVVQVVIMILAAGVFMGILTESKMAEAIAMNLVALIPSSLVSHLPIVTAVISLPGTFFLSNDAFYFGILPVLIKTGAAYGITPLQIGVAALTGQSIHLLSPLVASNYLLLGLTDQDMGEWQKFCIGFMMVNFVIYVGALLITGAMPF